MPQSIFWFGGWGWWGNLMFGHSKPSQHTTSTFSRSSFSRISSIITSMGVAVEISWKPEYLPPNIKAMGLPSSVKTMDPESPFLLNGSHTPAPIMQSARPSPYFPYFSASISLTLPAVHLVVLPHLNTRGGKSTVFASSFLSFWGGGSM